jgi:hypothetical protein
MPVILATWEAEIRRITVQGQSGEIFHLTHLQNNQSKMDWSRCGSGNRVPALQVQSPEFKPQSNKQTNKQTKTPKINERGK